MKRHKEQVKSTKVEGRRRETGANSVLRTAYSVSRVSKMINQEVIGGEIWEVLTTFCEKQSQFENGLMNINSFLKKDYGNGPRFEGLKNKANSKPICRPSVGNPKH